MPAVEGAVFDGLSELRYKVLPTLASIETGTVPKSTDPDEIRKV